MKCVKNPSTGEIKCLDDWEAIKMYTRYRWVYVSKSEYKAWIVANSWRGK